MCVKLTKTFAEVHKRNRSRLLLFSESLIALTLRTLLTFRSLGFIQRNRSRLLLFSESLIALTLRTLLTFRSLGFIHAAVYCCCKK